MPIITDLSPPQTAEGLILGAGGSSPLNLGNGGSLQLSALVIPSPAKRPEWASNGDVDGAELVRIPLHDNRDCSFKVRAMDGTMDQAVAAIKLLEDKLQEACALGAGGGPGLAFLWTPAHATVGLTGYMVFAQITDMPITYDDGWFAQHPVLTVAFICKPFLYGAEVTGPTATGTTPVLTVAVPSVPGDVPAEARLVITDGSTQARRWVEWGLEQRYYNAGTPSSLLIDSEDLVTTGFSGAQFVHAGTTEYKRAGATNAYITSAILSQPVAICGTGDQAHIGTFRIKTRARSGTAAAAYYRLTWKVGDGPPSSNAWTQPNTSGDWSEIDLGLISVDPAAAGAQKWSGQIEAYTTNPGNDTADIDYLMLFPVAEGYGRLEGAYSYRPGVITAHDEFTGTTAGSALNARSAPLGGAWATSGATTDFVFADAPPGMETIKRTTSSDTGFRFAILGSATPTDSEVGVAARQDPNGPPWATVIQAVIARWTDASNYLRLSLNSTGLNISQATATLAIEQVLAGSVTTLAAGTVTVSLKAFYSLRLIAFASGHIVGWLFDSSGNTLLFIDAFSTTLATGGTLASGKVGVADANTTVPFATRYMDTFYAATPTAETVIVNGGRSLQVRSDSNLRQSSDGTTYGDIASRGSRLFIPQAGDGARTSRIAVRAVREDVVTSASRNDADSITLATFFTPRYLAVPR